MGKQSPFENAMIRRFVSPNFHFLFSYHIQSQPINYKALSGMGKHRENKQAYILFI